MEKVEVSFIQLDVSQFFRQADLCHLFSSTYLQGHTLPLWGNSTSGYDSELLCMSFYTCLIEWKTERMLSIHLLSSSFS